MVTTITGLPVLPVISGTEKVALDTATANSVNVSVNDITEFVKANILSTGNIENFLGMILYGEQDNSQGNLLEWNGTTHLRADYPELMALWIPVYTGQTWFDGNGTTTFGVPPATANGLFLRSRTGSNNGNIVADTIKNHTHPVPNHNHTTNSINVNWKFEARRIGDTPLLDTLVNIVKGTTTGQPAGDQEEVIFNTDTYTYNKNFTVTVNNKTGLVTNNNTGGATQTQPHNLSTKMWVVAKPLNLVNPNDPMKANKTEVLFLNGTTIPTSDIDWGGNKITNAAEGTDPSDVATVSQLSKPTQFIVLVNTSSGIAVDQPTDALAPVFAFDVTPENIVGDAFTFNPAFNQITTANRPMYVKFNVTATATQVGAGSNTSLHALAWFGGTDALGTGGTNGGEQSQEIMDSSNVTFIYIGDRVLLPPLTAIQIKFFEDGGGTAELNTVGNRNAIRLVIEELK